MGAGSSEHLSRLLERAAESVEEAIAPDRVAVVWVDTEGGAAADAAPAVGDAAAAAAPDAAPGAVEWPLAVRPQDKESEVRASLDTILDALRKHRKELTLEECGPAPDGRGATVVFPIGGGARLLGAIVVFRFGDGAEFSESECRIGRALARQTAAAVEFAWEEESRDWAYLESLFANAPEAVVLLDAHHRVRRINDMFTEIFGYTEEEIRGGLIDDYVAAGEYWSEARGVSARVEDGGHMAFESRRRRKDGSEIDVSVLGAPVFEKGEIVGIFGIYRDISEQKRMEAALRESEARYRDLFEEAPIGIFQTHADGRLVRANGTIARILGYDTAAELVDAVNGSAYEIYADADVRESFLAQLRAEGAVSSFEYEAVCRDGSRVIFSETSRISQWHSSQDFVIDGFVVDVTALKRAQRDLADKEHRLRDIFDAARDVALMLAEPRGETGELVVTEFSAGARRILGYESSDVLGRPLLDLGPEADRDELALRFRRVIEEGKAINEERRLRRRDEQEVPVLFTAHPLVDPQERVGGVVVVAVDIGERKRAERAIEESLREKEMLLQEIHHRVKNNMQIISSILSLEIGHLADPTVGQALGASQSRIRSMSLVHEKLYRSRDLARVDLGDYMSDLISDLQSLSTDHARITLDLNAEQVFAGVDFAIPFGLVVNELVTNAFKHARAHAETATVSVRLHLTTEGTVLEVSDNGPGFPEDFDPEEGQTLGLELVRSLVAQLNGTMEHDTDDGAVWRLVFPHPKG